MAKMNWRSQADRDKAEEIKELQKLLKDTDFYYLRRIETGEAVKPEVVTKRTNARNRLRELGL